jgi:hypothetical protein
MMNEVVVPGDNSALQNVVVCLKGDFSQYSFSQPVAAQMDQNGCIFTPHVLAVMTGAPIEFRTHGQHDAQHPSGPECESCVERIAAARRLPDHQDVCPRGNLHPQCNLHPWMSAYVAVIGNPYFQVTGRDGSFHLEGVPPGSYTLIAWHEQYGAIEQSITLEPSQALNASITLHIPQQ